MGKRNIFKIIKGFNRNMGCIEIVAVGVSPVNLAKV